MQDKPQVRYVNRSREVFRASSPRGGRIALAPGEFTTNPYFERFARLASEPIRPIRGNALSRPLVKEWPDGTPYGVEMLPTNEGIRAPTSIVAPTQRLPHSQVVVPPSGCSTTCEAACEFPAEVGGVAAGDINHEMDKDAPPPLPDHPEFPSPPTAVQAMRAVEHKMERGMAPPIPTLAAATDIPVPPPPPKVNENLLESHESATTVAVMAKFNLKDEDVLEVANGYMKVMLEGKPMYVSTTELGWKTDHLPAMKAFITKKAAVVTA